MLHRDYIVEITRRLGDVLTRWLRPAVIEGDLDAIEHVEAGVARLIDLDPATALSLAPESLVTMMDLSGVADSVAGYASYALLRVGDAYETAGDGVRAQVRRSQAASIAQAFGCELGAVPQEYEDLERQIAAEQGEE